MCSGCGLGVVAELSCNDLLHARCFEKRTSAAASCRQCVDASIEECALSKSVLYPEELSLLVRVLVNINLPVRNTAATLPGLGAHSLRHTQHQPASQHAIHHHDSAACSYQLTCVAILHSFASMPDSCSLLLTPSPMRMWQKPISLRNSSFTHSLMSEVRATWRHKQPSSAHHTCMVVQAQGLVLQACHLEAHPAHRVYTHRAEAAALSDTDTQAATHPHPCKLDQRQRQQQARPTLNTVVMMSTAL